MELWDSDEKMHALDISEQPSPIWAVGVAPKELQSVEQPSVPSPHSPAPMSDDEEQDMLDADRWIDADLQRVLARDEEAWAARELRVHIW
jgi:hypothetical protein